MKNHSMQFIILIDSELEYCQINKNKYICAYHLHMLKRKYNIVLVSHDVTKYLLG